MILRCDTGSSTGNYVVERTSPAQGPGFIFYIKGQSFVMELEGGQLPAAGTQWTMRNYVGAIAGGTGRERDDSAPRELGGHKVSSRCRARIPPPGRLGQDWQR